MFSVQFFYFIDHTGGETGLQALFDPGADFFTGIENCIVADGCILEGEAEDSVLFRNVTICKGAEVENCVIMNDTVVGEGSELKYVILDKDVTVRPGSKLIGTPKNPIIIKRGDVV